MSEWNDRREVKKGTLGEQLVQAYFADKDVVIYRPDALAGAHPFDMLAASRDKKTLCVVEVKTKPARTHFPDTGFDLRHNHDYLTIAMKYSMDVFVYFVDENSASIYGGELISELHKPRQIEWRGKLLLYPMTSKGIIYFPVSIMTTVASLDRSYCEELRALGSGRNGLQGTLDLGLS